MNRNKAKLVVSLVMFLCALLCNSWAVALAEETLQLPNDIADIGEGAFENVRSFTEVEVPDGLRSIGARAFAYSSLKDITLPYSVNSIADDAFEGVSEDCVITVHFNSPAYQILSKADLPCILSVIDQPGIEAEWEYYDYTYEHDKDGRLIVTVHGESDEDYYLPELILPDTLNWEKIDEMIIADGAFEGYHSEYSGSNDETLTLPECVTYIGDNAFDSAALTGVLKLPDGITHIGKEAFRECHGFSGNLVLPSQLAFLGKSAFSNDEGFTGDLIIPDKLDEIPDECFTDCSGLTSLKLGAGIKRIGDFAFARCAGLTGSVTIPDQVSVIGESAFMYDSGLEGTLTLGNSVRTIGANAFCSCGLTGSLTIPQNVRTIGAKAFSGNAFNGSLTLSDGIARIEAGVFSLNRFTGALTLPASVEIIGEGAFEGNAFDGTLSLPYGLEEIHSNAFKDCKELTGDLTLPDTVTLVGDSAFENCTGLDGQLRVGASLGSIGEFAFAHCAITGDVLMPKYLASIGSGAFYDCKGLDGTVKLSPNLDRDSLVCGWSIIEAKDYTGIFEDCINIKQGIIPNGLEIIPMEIFWGCTGLTKVNIPDSVKRIGLRAFSDCTSLSYVKMSSNLEILESLVFSGCSRLSGVLDLSGVDCLYHEYYAYAKAQFSDCESLSGVVLSDNAIWAKGMDIYDDVFEGHGEDFTVYCREGSMTAELCEMHGHRYQCIYGSSFASGLLTSQHSMGAPFSLKGYFESDRNILKLRGTISTQYDFTVLQQVETDINSEIAHYSQLNGLLRFEDLSEGDYCLQLDVLFEEDTDYTVVGVSTFSVVKSGVRIWETDGFSVPSGLYMQNTEFTPAGGIRMNRDIEAIQVNIKGKSGNGVFSNTLAPNDKVVLAADMLNGFRMQDLQPDNYRLAIELTCGGQTFRLADYIFRIYRYDGSIGEETAKALIAFCEDSHSLSIFQPYAMEYRAYMDRMDLWDEVVMTVCNAKKIVSDTVLNFLREGKGNGYVKKLYKKALYEMMCSFDDNSGGDLELVETFEDFFKAYYKDPVKVAGFGVDYEKQMFDSEFFDATLEEYCNHYSLSMENLTIGDAFVLQDAYEMQRDFIKKTKGCLKKMGECAEVVKYSLDVVEIISDALKDHEKGLLAMASLAKAYGDSIPVEMKEALEEIMSEYQSNGITAIAKLVDYALDQIKEKITDDVIELCGAFAFRKLVDYNGFALTCKVTTFILEKGLEITGLQKRADDNFEFLTLANLLIESHSAYCNAVSSVRGGDGPDPDPSKANTSTDALNQVRYTFEATKYAIDEVYSFLIDEAGSDARKVLKLEQKQRAAQALSIG